jgi:uncharacterized membrane protein
MATKTENKTDNGLKGAFQDALGALGDRAMHMARERITGLTDRLTELGDGSDAAKTVAADAAKESAEGGSPVKGAVKGAVSAGKDKLTDALPGSGGGGKKSKREATKAMNFVDSIEVGVPVRVAFNQWTQYEDWPNFMKKVERADHEPDSPKVNMKAQVFWFHRSWEATIQDQIPDERILWRSTGQKGHIDGCVTFHEIGPRLTRILVTMEYYPQGIVERVGNLWRAPGRRARLELKHFRRHVMMNTILAPDDVEGWRGEIEDGEVTFTHDEIVQEEQRAKEEAEENDDSGDDQAGDDDQAADDQAADDQASDDQAGDDEAGDDEAGDDESGDDQASDDQDRDQE